MKSSGGGQCFCAAAVVFFALAALSCGGGSSNPSRIHVLRVPEPPSATPEALVRVIGVEHFSATTPLQDWRILRYPSPTQLEYYDDDRWVSEPSTMVAEVAAQMLERMGIARQARVLPWVDQMDYLLQGQILNFEEVDAESEHVGRVAIELSLLSFPKREVVWSGTFRAQKPIASDGVTAAVEALSAATHEVLKQGFENLALHLKSKD
jgi:ABC-type uncharacterized transport system auxiliary subunit